jgi:hypothetical protein
VADAIGFPQSWHSVTVAEVIVRAWRDGLTRTRQLAEQVTRVRRMSVRRATTRPHPSQGAGASTERCARIRPSYRCVRADRWGRFAVQRGQIQPRGPILRSQGSGGSSIEILTEVAGTSGGIWLPQFSQQITSTTVTIRPVGAVPSLAQLAGVVARLNYADSSTIRAGGAAGVSGVCSGAPSR